MLKGLLGIPPVALEQRGLPAVNHTPWKIMLRGNMALSGSMGTGQLQVGTTKQSMLSRSC